MHELVSDIVGFLKTLNQIDFLLYIAVLFLVILVVSLLYIIKNSSNEEDETPKPSSTEFDIKETINNLEAKNPDIIEYTPYEEEQEQKAIISYDELIAQNQKKDNLNEKIVPHDDLYIKQINLVKNPDIPDLPKKVNETEEVKDSNLNSNYEKQETFLNNLKAFLKFLN